MNEMPGDDRHFPPALAEVAEVEFDFGDDDTGVDFEPYAAFPSAQETTDWLRHWTDHTDGRRSAAPYPSTALTCNRVGSLRRLTRRCRCL
ncbi:hypothetical protein [Streptomyces sp. NPDC059649]|uniref:hypothetical protein n=1 Tax=Streptomyces sp. NPDC059649 TaxID=3346895 RepID=UPI0036CDA4DC